MQHELVSLDRRISEPRGRGARGDGAARGRAARPRRARPRRSPRPTSGSAVLATARDEKLARDRRRPGRPSPADRAPAVARAAGRPAGALRQAPRAEGRRRRRRAARSAAAPAASSTSTTPTSAVISAAPDDEVIRCEECQRILVRTARVRPVTGPRSVVIEADGGSRGNPGPAAYGAVLKDADTGAVIAEDGEHDRGRDQQRRGVLRADRRARAGRGARARTPTSRSGWTPSSSSSRCPAAGRSSTPT